MRPRNSVTHQATIVLAVGFVLNSEERDAAGAAQASTARGASLGNAAGDQLGQVLGHRINTAQTIHSQEPGSGCINAAKRLRRGVSKLGQNNGTAALAGTVKAALLPATTYDGTEPSEPRACLLATTTTPSGPVTIGSTHLPRAQDSSRKHATERLLELLQTITGPLLVFGDFNQPPNAWLEEQTFLTTPAPQATYPADNPTEAIDYCVTAATTITKSIILNDNGSDHKAVLVTTR
jgi:endonuclease/exonuclease/phosphatase family metal-dependent hydrolase